jgi:glycosyltransferase involved in cell wall biosynthesis
VPYITLPRGLLSPWALNHKGLKKRVYWTLLARRIVARSAALVALARQEEDDIVAVGIKQPVHVIPNGAFVDGLAEDDDAAGASTGVVQLPAPNECYILFLGRVHPKKGLDVLLPTFDLLARSFPDVTLVIAGSVDADYAARFDALLAQTSARAHVRLVGNVSGATKAALLRGASVFALTSYSEGLPVAVLEALAAGVPVVLTPGCNLPEVAAAHAGLEVKAAPDEAARALARVLGDPALRATLAANALRLARESFSWDAVGRRMLALCSTVASNRPLTVAA